MHLDTIPDLPVSLAKRLQAGGIETAEQLAATDIAVRRTLPEDSPCEGLAGLERHESFTVGLSIDPTGDVCRTIVHHVRSGIDQGFSGFDAADVAEFIGRHAKVAAS